jgi:CheY-like chemotaxis protein
MADPGRPLRVLLVDDQQEITGVFAELLRDVGQLEVHTAEDGAAALDVFYAIRPDCVVVDVKMPELTGDQFIRIIRGDPETADTPLVIHSALAQGHEIFAGLAAGADIYLTKPVTPTELLGAIRQGVLVSQQQRDQRMHDLATQDPPSA